MQLVPVVLYTNPSLKMKSVRDLLVAYIENIPFEEKAEKLSCVVYGDAY